MINVFGMHFDFIILHVSTIMEVPLLKLQIGPCLKWEWIAVEWNWNPAAWACIPLDCDRRDLYKWL